MDPPRGLGRALQGILLEGCGCITWEDVDLKIVCLCGSGLSQNSSKGTQRVPGNMVRIVFGCGMGPRRGVPPWRASFGEH